MFDSSLPADIRTAGDLPLRGSGLSVLCEKPSFRKL